MEERGYYKGRVDEKFEKWREYDFSRREHSAITKSDVLGILQDFLRESKSICDMCSFSKEVLKRHYSTESDIYLLKEEGSVKLVKCNDPEVTLDNLITETILKEEHYPKEKVSHEIYVSLKGDNQITKKLGYPSNENDIVGALHVRSNTTLDEEDMLFIKTYGRRVGPAIHQQMNNDYVSFLYESLKEANERSETANEKLRGLQKTGTHDLMNILKSSILGVKYIIGKNKSQIGGGLVSEIDDALSSNLEEGEQKIKDFFKEIIHDEICRYDLRYLINDLVLGFMKKNKLFDISLDNSLRNIPSGIEVDVDKKDMISLTDNILGNAVKHGGPTCTIAVGYIGGDEHYDPVTFWNSIIHHDGWGASKKSEFSGHGTGICDSIMEKYGGKFEIKDEDNGKLAIAYFPKKKES